MIRNAWSTTRTWTDAFCLDRRVESRGENGSEDFVDVLVIFLYSSWFKVFSIFGFLTIFFTVITTFSDKASFALHVLQKTTTMLSKV